MSIFTDNLKKLIEKRGTTYAELSRELGISKNGLRYWETAGNIPNIRILKKIADHFGTTVEYLIGQTDDPNQPESAAHCLLDKNILQLSGRTGRYVERELSDEQFQMLLALLELPKA